MAVDFLVNGEAMISVCAITGTLTSLGVTIDGVLWQPRIHRRPLMLDSTGGTAGVPCGHQYLGEDGFIIARGVHVFDPAILNTILSPLLNGTPGLMSPIGTILDPLTPAASGYHRLCIQSPIAGVPHNFPKAFLMNPGYPLSTRTSELDLTWYYMNSKYGATAGPTGSYNSIITWNTTNA